MNTLRHFRAGDLLTVVLGMFAVIWLMSVSWHGSTASRVLVRAGGKIVADTRLDQSQRILAQGPLGTSIIEISGRRARVAADPGPRQYCVKQGWLSHAGDAALCLPNQVSVELVGASPRFDSLNY